MRKSKMSWFCNSCCHYEPGEFLLHTSTYSLELMIAVTFTHTQKPFLAASVVVAQAAVSQIFLIL